MGFISPFDNSSSINPYDPWNSQDKNSANYEKVPGYQDLYYCPKTGGYCTRVKSAPPEPDRYFGLTDLGNTKDGGEVYKSMDGKYYIKNPASVYPGTDIPELSGPYSMDPRYEQVPGQQKIYYNSVTDKFYSYNGQYMELKYVGTTSSGYVIYQGSNGKYYEEDSSVKCPGTDIPSLYGPFDNKPK